MYMLKFDTSDESKKRFEFTYDGFMIGSSFVNQKGLPVLKKELSILDKLESISQPYPCGKKLMDDEPKRETIGGEISLTPDEFDMVCQYIGNVPWKTGTPARNAIKTLDWLKSTRVD